MSTALLSGNLVFVRRGDVLYSSGLVNGHVALRGPLSQDRVTVGVIGIAELQKELNSCRAL